MCCANGREILLAKPGVNQGAGDMHSAVIIGMFPEYPMLRAGGGWGVPFPRPCPAPGLGGAKLGVFGEAADHPTGEDYRLVYCGRSSFPALKGIPSNALRTVKGLGVRRVWTMQG